jgi:hypothetical protein
MSDLHDFDLDGSDSEPSKTPSPPQEPEGPGYLPLVAGALLVAAIIVLVFWFLSRDAEVPAPGRDDDPGAGTSQESAPPPEQAPAAPTVEPLPSLAESDGFVRNLLRRLSDHPALGEWLATPYLVESFVAAIENLSLGASPARHLSAFAPDGSFEAEQSADGLTATAATYARYDLVTGVFARLDPRASADVYRRLKPLLQEAYAELGYPDRDFDEAVTTTIRMLLATPTPASAPALERTVASFRYADPALEELPAAQKQFLRLGPANMTRIKAQLRRLADELELDVE